MAFVHKRLALFAPISVLSTAALLLVGNGMNPLWLVMWVAPIPVLLLAAETTSWWIAAGAAALSMLLGSLTMLYYLHFVPQAPVTARLVPFSIASLLLAGGVLLFRGLLYCGAVLSAMIALPAFWTLCEYLASFAPANGTAGSLAYYASPDGRASHRCVCRATFHCILCGDRTTHLIRVSRPLFGAHHRNRSLSMRWVTLGTEQRLEK